MYHSTALPIAWGDGSYVNFARQFCDTLIIQVHGFGGDTATTWTGLEKLCNDTAETRSADIVSFGYGSTRTRAALSATMLREFVDAITADDPLWERMAREITGEQMPRQYENIYVVAHSLGAAVSRRAILDAIEIGQSWPERTRLVLFAPAHMGTRLLDEEDKFFSPGSLVSRIFVAWNILNPAVDDLKADSSFIRHLRDDTKMLVDAGWREPLKATQVLFGQFENVVCVDRFCIDPIATVWPKHSHVSICKVPEASKFVSEAIR